jgi:hypothetical protein
LTPGKLNRHHECAISNETIAVPKFKIVMTGCIDTYSLLVLIHIPCFVGLRQISLHPSPLIFGRKKYEDKFSSLTVNQVASKAIMFLARTGNTPRFSLTGELGDKLDYSLALIYRTDLPLVSLSCPSRRTPCIPGPQL